MKEIAQAEILTVGTELLEPGREDANSAYLIEKLASVGVAVLGRTTVGDDRRLIAEALLRAFSHANWVVVTGGLGPTGDDLTREGVSDAFDLELVIDERVLEGIRERFARRKMPMPDVNRRQAMVPRGARVLPNPAGTAPGLWISIPQGGGNELTRHVVLLPGPPREARSVFETHVLPVLKERGRSVVYRTKRLFIVGLPESSVEERVGSIYQAYHNPRTGILASAGQVELRLTAHGLNIEEADERLEALSSRLRAVLGLSLFSESGESLEQVVGALLAGSGKTVAIAESLTGGLIAHRLTEVPGSSAYFERGLVTYSNRSKTELVGVSAELVRDYGAVSEPVARAMARGARERAGTDLGLAVTGIAGPQGGTAEKPVGLIYAAVSDIRADEVERYLLPGSRSQVKWWTSQLALNLLRLRLLQAEDRGGGS